MRQVSIGEYSPSRLVEARMSDRALTSSSPFSASSRLPVSPVPIAATSTCSKRAWLLTMLVPTSVPESRIRMRSGVTSA